MPSYLLRTKNLRAPKLLLLGGAICGTTLAQADVIYAQDFENWSNTNGLWSSNTQANLGGAFTNVLGRFSSKTVSLNVFATPENTGGFGGNGDGSTPFNITVNPLDDNRDRIPHLDQGGGGPGGETGDTNADLPQLDLGGAVSDGTNHGPPMFGPGTYAVQFDLMIFDSWDGNYAPFGDDSFAVRFNGQMLFDELIFANATHANFREPDETPSQNVYNQEWRDIIYRDITLEIEILEATDQLNVDFIGRLSQSILDESWGIDNVSLEQVSSSGVPSPGSLMILGGGLALSTRRRR